MRIKCFSVFALLSLSACRPELPRASAASASDPIRTIVDSIFPVEEEIRRFKIAHRGASAAQLEHAASSRDELVERFLLAIETPDTTELRALTLNAAEFIDLYYPTSQYSRPPYRQSPALVWLLHLKNSEAGLQRGLASFGGQPSASGYTCSPAPRLAGPNQFWECSIQFSRGRAVRLFSSIMERDGRFKIVSYANRL